MTKKPILLPENATVIDAIKKMQHIGCGILPIGNNETILGVITDRDILLRVILKHKPLNETPVVEVMTKGLIFCNEDDTLQQAVYLMNLNNIRRILIKDKTSVLTGILSLGDILRRVYDKNLLFSLFNLNNDKDKI